MKKRVLLMATIMTLVSVCAFGQSARKSYKAGLEFVENLKYDDAIVQFTSAIGLEPSNPDYYFARGQAYEKLSKYTEAKADFEKSLVFSPKDVESMISLGAVCNKMGDYEQSLKLLNHASSLDKRNVRVYPEKVITLTNLKRYDQALQVSDTAIIIKDTPKEAMDQCNEVIKNNDRNTAAYLQRSKVYKKNLDYPNAINDISKTILIDPANPMFYFERGKYYQEFNQHINAINDFSKCISLQAAIKTEDPSVYYARAKSYEEISDWDKAKADYNKITVLSKYDQNAREMLEVSQKRLYDLNRETDPPEITFISPVPAKDTMEIKGDKTTLLISGTIKDKSKIKSFMINNESVILVEKNGEYDFLANINVNSIDKITVSAIDDYNNERALKYALKRTEINPPKIMIIAPYTSEEGQVFLDTTTPNIAIQGKISDESRIKSITVGNFTASYNPNELNPAFTA